MMNLSKFKNLQRETKDMINIDPLQAGGILTSDAKKALIEWGAGYSICDFCPGVLDQIKKPPIFDFVHSALPEFLGVDEARVTEGAREGKFIVMHSITNPKDTIIVDSNAHYTTYVAAERCGLKIVEVPNSGYPKYEIKGEDYEPLIKKHKPSLVVLTWPDGSYGNYADAKKVGKICKKYKVPLLLNAAYSIGRRPINAKELGADFVVGSGHKSMAASGPVGVLGVNKPYADGVFRVSKKFSNKPVELLGCTARGATIMTLIASFPEVVDRVKKWNEQVKKVQWFSKEAEKLGLKQLGQKPHQHDLIAFEAKNFYELSKTHKRKGYFLYSALKEAGIWGIKPGLTKHFKLSTFAASKNELEKVLEVFKQIINKN